MTERQEVYGAYREKVFAYLSGKVRSREDAEDLCSDVFEQVFCALPRFDPEKAALNTWIFAIARYTLIDYFRRGRRQSVPLREEFSRQEDPETALLREETLARLAAGLEGMEQQKRDIIVLRYYEGYSLTYISQLTGISYGMVKVKHRQALEALRRQLG